MQRNPAQIELVLVGDDAPGDVRGARAVDDAVGVHGAALQCRHCRDGLERRARRIQAGEGDRPGPVGGCVLGHREHLAVPGIEGDQRGRTRLGVHRPLGEILQPGIESRAHRRPGGRIAAGEGAGHAAVGVDGLHPPARRILLPGLPCRPQPGHDRGRHLPIDGEQPQLVGQVDAGNSFEVRTDRFDVLLAQRHQVDPRFRRGRRTGVGRREFESRHGLREQCAQAGADRGHERARLDGDHRDRPRFHQRHAVGVQHRPGVGDRRVLQRLVAAESFVDHRGGPVDAPGPVGGGEWHRRRIAPRPAPAEVPVGAVRERGVVGVLDGEVGVGLLAEAVERPAQHVARAVRVVGERRGRCHVGAAEGTDELLRHLLTGVRPAQHPARRQRQRRGEHQRSAPPSDRTDRVRPDGGHRHSARSTSIPSGSEASTPRSSPICYRGERDSRSE